MRIARIVFGIRLAPAMLGAQLLLVQSVRLPAADYSAVFDRHEIEVSISKGTTTADSYQKTERGRSATIEVDAAKAASAGSGLKVSLTVEDRSPSPMLLEQCGPLNSNCTNNAKPKTLVTYSANFQRNDAALRYRGRHGFSSFSSSTGTGSDCNPDYNPWIDLPMGATKADHAAECTYSALQPRFARRADYETEESVSRQAGFSMDEGGRASYGILITIRTVYRFSRPMIRVEPQRLEMTAVARSQVPETAGFRLANSGGYLLRWRLKASYELGSWATVKPDTGDPLRPGQGIDVTVTVDPGRQNAGVTNARIEVESNGQWPYSAPDPETPVIPLKVTFVDQRDALSIASPAPPAGTKIKPDTSVSFAATVAYALASRESAGLVLRLFDQNGDALASSDPATVNRGSSQMQLTTPAIRIPGKVARLGLQALLLNPAGESILGSNTIGYEMETPVAPPEPKPTNGVSLQAGEGGVWPGEPFKPPPPACALMPDREGILKSLNCIPTGRLEYTLNQSRGRIELDVTQKLRSGEVIRQRPAVHSWNVKQGERKVFWFDIRGPLLHVHDVDADIWELRARLIPSEGEIVVSEPAALPVQRVHVRPWRRSPLPSSALPIGEKPVFMNQVEYNVVLGGPLYLIGSLSYLVCGVPIHEQYWPFSSPLFAGETTRSPEPDVVVPEKEIPPNTWEVEIAYFLVPEGHRQPFGDKYGEDRIRYRRFASQATVPAGAGKTKIEPGVTLETIKNEAIKQLTAARVAQDMLGAMNSKPGGSLDPGARANTPWRAAQTAELVAVKDLLGLGATWQFDPPIAENGTFQADLKLEYDPGQFPDDPRFQESVLRIVSYDPGTG
ncbi:MAG: hypothetical protein HY822_05270, partial [Acidobacteria bacterium]|nr:hypothetical protein [Acidobacteriota bacterium]